MISIGNRMNASAIRDLWAGTSDVLKVLKLARAVRRVQFENFQNITRARP